MRGAWRRLGLRGRLALSIAAIVLAAFAILFVAVRGEMSGESAVIKREENREARGGTPPGRSDSGETSPLSPVEEAQNEVERTFAIAGVATLAAALLAGYLLAARTAAPLRRMASTAAAVDAGDLDPRIGAQASAAVEVRTLAEAFDHMLDRLDAAFSRQRQFVSDASHELRTPLTAIRGQLEVLAAQRRPSPAEVRRVEGVVLTEMGRIERLVDDLLTLARLDEGAPLRRGRIPLAPFLRRLAREPSLGGVAVGEVPSGFLRADPDRLTQVIRNLLANARRHAGPAGRVEISAVARGALLTIRVDDDGPGVPPGGAAARLRALPPQRGGPRPRLRRQRPGAGDRPFDRRAARRADLGRGLAAGRGAGRLRAGRLRASARNCVDLTVRFHDLLRRQAFRRRAADDLARFGAVLGPVAGTDDRACFVADRAAGMGADGAEGLEVAVRLADEDVG